MFSLLRRRRFTKPYLHCSAENSNTINNNMTVYAGMKRESSMVDDLHLGAEEAKELELDEQPRPTRKAGGGLSPSAQVASKMSHKKIKGTRKIK